MRRYLPVIPPIFTLLLILTACMQYPGTATAPGTPGAASSSNEASLANGRSIYFNGVSLKGGRIVYSGVQGMMMGGALSCATCHGQDGHGGQVFFMMRSYDIPNITWADLTGPDPDMDHPPYTEETVKRAITQGLEPGGDQLEYPMPRWQMSEGDLNDLVSFIKTLK